MMLFTLTEFSRPHCTTMHCMNYESSLLIKKLAWGMWDFPRGAWSIFVKLRVDSCLTIEFSICIARPFPLKILVNLHLTHSIARDIRSKW